MSQFRKKPVVIEAVQWFPPGDERHDPSLLSHRKGNSVDPGDYLQLGDLFATPGVAIEGFPAQYFIKTLEGNMKVSPGDYIITGVAGEKYNCKPDIFVATYEPIEKTTIDTKEAEQIPDFLSILEIEDEKAALDEKIEKLKAFLETKPTLSKDEGLRLAEQCCVMEDYSAILHERIRNEFM